MIHSWLHSGFAKLKVLNRLIFFMYDISKNNLRSPIQNTRCNSGIIMIMELKR